MIHQTIVVGPLQCNCVLLGCEKTGEGLLIDPGDEPSKIIKELEGKGLKIKYLLHTHAHFDHIGATGAIKKQLGAIPCLHKADEPLYANLPLQGKYFGFSFDEAPPIEKYLEDEEILSFGEHRLQVIHTPGHSPGSICFKLLDGSEALFSGDTLFRQSVGRTDLWGGDQDQMMRAIKNRLMVLDGDITVYPGHGPSTTIADEKRMNPFLR